MPHLHRHARPRTAPARRPTPMPAVAPVRLADRAVAPLTDEPRHARALQQRLVHRFDHGEAEAPAVRRYPPGVRLMLLLGATVCLWWSLYVLTRVALG